MDSGGNEVAAGLIPSRNRWEKRMKSRDKGVQWNDGMGTGKRTGSLKKMPFLKVSSASYGRIRFHTFAQGIMDLNHPQGFLTND